MPVIETKISIDSEEYLLNYKHHQELSVELSYLLHEKAGNGTGVIHSLVY